MKSVFLIAAMLAGSYANAFTLKAGTIKGHTNSSPALDCQLDLYSDSYGGFNAAVIINGKQQYGFAVAGEVAEAIKAKSNLKGALIGGRFSQPGDKALLISVENNELISFTYKGLSERSGEAYGIKCIF